MKRRINFLFAFSLVLNDALMTAVAFYLAHRLRIQTEYPPAVNVAPFRSYIGMLAVQVATLLAIFYVSKLYHLKRGTSLIDQLGSVFTAASIAIVIGLAATSFLFKDLDYSRLMLAYAWLLTIGLVSVGRIVLNRLHGILRARGVAPDRALIVGASEVGRNVLDTICATPSLGYKTVGFVDDHSPTDAPLRAPILGKTTELASVIDRYAIDEVIIALPEASHEEILSIIARCDQERVTVKVLPDVFQIIASEICTADLRGIPLLTVRGWKLSFKRVMDLVGSAVALVLFSPVMLLTAILIKLDSPGPAFYAQERVGLDGKPFQIIKFRSMHMGAEDATGPVWAQRDDPRRTRIGAIIRRFSIDEFPQFINVLLGEMSLVGPRPERPVFVEQFRQMMPRYVERHREKAGLTGWAQVSGLRGDSSILERTQYDLWYSENWSIFLDLKIILRTIPKLFRDRQAI
jgi:exopolysaccharide biosynthesis polyprenyl glycosylphosphotransferase